jgi:hypothetical protein
MAASSTCNADLAATEVGPADVVDNSKSDEIIVRYPGTVQAAMETEVSKLSEQKPPQAPLPDTWELP